MANTKRTLTLKRASKPLGSATCLTILAQIYVRFSFASHVTNFSRCATRRSGYEPPVSHVKLLVAPSNSLREEAREPHHERKHVSHRQKHELCAERTVLHAPH